MNKVLLIGFGGTISMVPNEHGALAPALSTEELVAKVPGLLAIKVELSVKQLLNKDSSELAPEDWQLLIAEVAVSHNNFDGIVVAHGTDTMAYSAMAVALALGDSVTIPIIFTGSQLPMVEPGTDAQANLERAVNVAKQAIEDRICEIMIVFDDRVMRAVRTIKVDESRFDAFDSPAYPRLADITATQTMFSPSGFRTKRGLIKKSLKLKQQFDTGVISIDARPGLRPEIVADIVNSPQCSALVLKSLGAGNVTVEGKYSLLAVIKQAVQSGKPVILATKFVGGKVVPGLYESGRAALEAGAGHSGDMTDVATEVKLMWLMGQGIRSPKQVNAAMLKSFVGEVSS